MSEYHNNSIFWVETNKIQPNPFQPRREFEPKALEDLADSIRQYGILQPLVVTRKEILRENDGGMDVQYELIAGERRLRASKIAGLNQIPVIIRKETDDKVKLELAIIENLQREDLNPIDRALAFEQLYKEFKITHAEIGKRMGKSRVYVSNTLRLLSLPENIKQGLMDRRITEGHTRPLLMLSDRPEEQSTLYKEIMVKKMSVRDAEKVARKIAQDKVRKKEFFVDPKIQKYEKQLSENLGTRVHIEAKENGGQITIDYFTLNDLEEILTSMRKVEREQSMMDSYLTGMKKQEMKVNSTLAEDKIEESTPVSFTEDSFQTENVIPSVSIQEKKYELINELSHEDIQIPSEPEYELTSSSTQEESTPDTFNNNYYKEEVKSTPDQTPIYSKATETFTPTQSKPVDSIENNSDLYAIKKEPSVVKELDDNLEVKYEDTPIQQDIKLLEDKYIGQEIPTQVNQQDSINSNNYQVQVPPIINTQVLDNRVEQVEKEELYYDSPTTVTSQEQEDSIYQELKDAYREPVESGDYDYHSVTQEPVQINRQQPQENYIQVQQTQYQQQRSGSYQQQPERKKSFLGKMFG